MKWLLLAALVLASVRERRMPDWPIQDRWWAITSVFDDVRTNRDGSTRKHRAIDIGTAPGPMVAPAGPTILQNVWFDSTYGGGLSALWKLPGGYTLGAAHLSAVEGDPGDRFVRGEVIAQTGKDEDDMLGHVHVTIRDPDGQKIDPLLYFTVPAESDEEGTPNA